MMLDVISDHFTSNYMNKQSTETFNRGTFINAKSSKSQLEQFPPKYITWRSNTDHSYQILKVIYKVRNTY